MSDLLLPTSDNNTPPACPKCGSAMVKRNSYRGPFWGCKTYPRCKGTISISGNTATAEKPEYKPLPDRKLTMQQDVIINAVKELERQPNEHIVIEAGPGSGKSYTIVKASEFVPSHAVTAFLVFGHENRRDLEGKVKPGIHCSTTHSLGLENIRAHLGNIKIDEYKVSNLLREEVKTCARGRYLEVLDESRSEILDLVSLCKNTLSEPTEGNLEWLCYRYNINTNGDSDYIFKAVRSLYHKSITAIKEKRLIDFDDMLFACASDAVAIPCKKFDYIFADEVQDFNAAQIKFVLKSVASHGHIIAVGDPLQSIFGFRGADINAMQNVTKALKAKTYPLSVCFRCPTSHIEYAKEISQNIVAAHGAKLGKIENIHIEKALAQIQPGDIAICRTNAPLIRPVYHLIRNGIKAVIRGREIGKNMVSLIDKITKKHGSQNIAQLMADMNEHVNRECEKLNKVEKHSQAQNLVDQYETIFAVSEGKNTISELKDAIIFIFDDEKEGVSFMTIHKAKGLEANNVYVLKPELLPHPMSKSPEDKQQEQNIIWVARTRSKENLYLVEGEL
jgi:DNA helicase II / ATP-dependent DNA helicase PcrA